MSTEWHSVRLTERCHRLPRRRGLSSEISKSAWTGASATLGQPPTPHTPPHPHPGSTDTPGPASPLAPPAATPAGLQRAAVQRGGTAPPAPPRPRPPPPARRAGLAAAGGSRGRAVALPPPPSAARREVLLRVLCAAGRGTRKRGERNLSRADGPPGTARPRRPPACGGGSQRARQDG